MHCSPASCARHCSTRSPPPGGPRHHWPSTASSSSEVLLGAVARSRLRMRKLTCASAAIGYGSLVRGCRSSYRSPYELRGRAKSVACADRRATPVRTPCRPSPPFKAPCGPTLAVRQRQPRVRRLRSRPLLCRSSASRPSRVTRALRRHRHRHRHRHRLGIQAMWSCGSLRVRSSQLCDACVGMCNEACDARFMRSNTPPHASMRASRRADCEQAMSLLENARPSRRDARSLTLAKRDQQND